MAESSPHVPATDSSTAWAVTSVLVVEDDKQMRDIIQGTLEDEGLAVETAAEGQQAASWLLRHRPLLVIVDWSLPLLDGAGVADAVRAAHGASVPILLITADGRAAVKARQMGATDYLHKPFEIDELIRTTHRLLTTR